VVSWYGVFVCFQNRVGFAGRIPNNGEEKIDIEELVAEYKCIASPKLEGNINWERIGNALQRECEWTQEGAYHLANLARKYGAFMLKNALALSVALQIEDGELGL